MQLTRAEDYGILFMAELAKAQPGVFVSVAEIAEQAEISRLFLNKIAQKLGAGKLIASKEGKGGGYALKRDAAKITLTQIIHALGSTMYINECANGCGRAHKCQYKKVWDGINARIVGELSKVTLAEFVKRSQEK